MRIARSILNCICGCSFISKISVCGVSEYDLIVIEDDATPLAANAGTYANYYLPTLCIVLAVFLAGVLIFWLIKRNNYKKRLLELRKKLDDNDRKASLTIRGIKDEISRLEAELVSECL